MFPILYWFLPVYITSGSEVTITGNLFSSHCIQCHGKDGKVKGKVDLLKYSTGEDLRDDPKLLQTVIDVIDFGEMPPEDEKQIPLQLRDSALSHLQTLLNNSVAKDPVFATTRIRRMNRFQYANAVQDLLKLKVSVFPLPEKMMRDRSGYFNKAVKDGMPDSLTVSSRPLGKSGLIEPRLSGVGPFPQDLRAEHGYDNQADHLSLSPLLMEAFFPAQPDHRDQFHFRSENGRHLERLFSSPPQRGRR